LQGIEIYTIIGLYFDDNDYGIHKSHSQLWHFWATKLGGFCTYAS
jgi:hypothetical protein